MARGPKLRGVDALGDLSRKIEVLEREMSIQRAAMERLKQIGPPPVRSVSYRTPVTAPPPSGTPSSTPSTTPSGTVSGTLSGTAPERP